MSRVSPTLWLVTLFALLALAFTVWSTRWRKHQPADPKITCLNNLRQVGFAFRIWANDHNGLFPFHVRTNSGGTLEFASSNPAGFDTNVALHLKVMNTAEELNSPLLLICPEDHLHKSAPELRLLSSSNITYLLRSGPLVHEGKSNDVLMVCPMDGNTLHADGNVTPGTEP